MARADARHLPAAVPLPELPNGRLIPVGDGIVALAYPDASNAIALQRLGVKTLVSEVPLDPSTAAAMTRAGIALVDAPIGSTFRHAAAILAAGRAGRVAVHCEHGVDRTGVTVAFLLHCLHGVPIGRALWAVVSPWDLDRITLAGVLEQRGLASSIEGVAPSQYSAAAVGGVGGLKVRPGGWQGTGYFDLVTSAIDAMEAFR